MNENHRVLLLPKRAAIARTVYRLCLNEYEDCYAAKIHREQVVSNTSYAAVDDAIHTFEEQGWIERESNSRVKQIRLTEEGKRIFAELVAFIEALEDEPWTTEEDWHDTALE
jgi:predicted transcriptional regulator